MILRLLADADLRGAIISGTVRRNPELDFKRAADVPLKGLDDGIVLDLAARDGRVLVSHDVTTMPDHFRDFTSRSPSPGVVLIPQVLSTGAAIEGFVRILSADSVDQFRRLSPYDPKAQRQPSPQSDPLIRASRYPAPP